MKKPAATEDDFKQRVEHVIRADIRALSAYHVAASAGMIKLDAMESPYTLPENLRQDWLAALNAVALNRYPDPDPQRLKSMFREAMGIDDAFAILLGNGSDEIIQMLCLAVQQPQPRVLAPSPSFVMFEMIARFCRLQYTAVPLRPDFSLDTSAMLDAIARDQPALVFLAYPNNPTGQLFDERDMRRVIEACPGLVVVDEAYYVFAGASAMNWLHEYPHMLLMRTVSKLGLAGLRLGLLIGAPPWLRELDKIRLPYNINSLTQNSAEFMLRHWNVLLEQARRIVTGREQLAAAMSAIPQVKVYPSDANFILFKVQEGRAQLVFDAVKSQGVLIKRMPAPGPLQDCLRVTVGSAEENSRFLSALTKSLAGISTGNRHD